MSSNNLNQLLIGVDKTEFLHRLTAMYSKNPQIIRLVEVCGLQWACHPLEESMTTEQIINYLKTIKTNKVMKKQESKFKNEIELSEIEKLDFAHLTDEGDAIEGILCSVQDIDFKSKNQDGSPKGKEKTFQIEVEGVKKHLPRNYELIKKLELVAIGTEIRIEVGGFTKLEGGKKVKNFKVLTA
ncbi:hypothetical protein [Flavobacterium sp.]|uniref:hypothetical protein n=1 Tax=Flavobacterium sp. TaxID=239 RepID=UPI00391DBA06